MLTPHTAFRRFADHWWLIALRGLLAIIFGITAWLWPGLTLTTLVLLVGAWLLVDGVFEIVSAFVNRDRVDSIWPLVLAGAINIVAGFVILAWPGLSAIAMMYMMGAWALFTGILAIIAAIRLRKVIANEWAIGLGGLVSVVFGALVMIFPGDGALALVWVIGIYAIIFGVTLIAAGFRLRSWRDSAPAA